MSIELTADQKALIDDKNFAHVATLFPDGRPQVTPTWVDRDGDLLLINSSEGRAKVENLRNDPRVAVEVSNSENPYQYVELRGEVVEFRHDGADEHIDALAKKYMGVDEYPMRQPGEVRVTIVIRPDRVRGWGS